MFLSLFVANFNVNKVIRPIVSSPAKISIPWVSTTVPRIIGPTNPPNAANELTRAIPTGAVDSVKKNVSKRRSIQ